ncbi:MAG: FAD-binding oxidoreductase [Candidatus Paceibacterota bacterium]
MLSQLLKEVIKGDVKTDDESLRHASRDASLFEVRPEVIVEPQDIEDLKALVKFASEKGGESKHISLTARSGGACMSGGPLTDSIVVDMKPHFNKIVEVTPEYAIVQPGTYYRDFEKETLRHDRLMPSYPASREICTVGGMVANNAGGEKTLAYGKTEDYVMQLKAVLADGNEYTFKPISKVDLEMKMRLQNFEGQLYRSVYEIVSQNKELLDAAKPKVSKNSAGYFLWNVWDGETFDMTRLLVGSQGTLGLISEIKFKLIQPKKLSKMLVVFMGKADMKNLGQIANEVLAFKPETFESYDKNTFKLALKFFPDLVKVLRPKNFFKMMVHFLPEFWMMLTGGLPELVLMAEFTGNDEAQIDKDVQAASEALKKLNLKTHITKSEEEEREFWVIRRESFNLLRNKVKGRQTAPFIDDVIVKPEHLPEFFPKLNELVAKYSDKLQYTIAGHIGDGNFHIIPLMDLSDATARAVIPKLSDEVYALVKQYNGSITAEHNDGIIRTPYLEQMYGEKVVELFKQVKNAFDPKNIFNPGKKVGGTKAFALAHMKKDNQHDV